MKKILTVFTIILLAAFCVNVSAQDTIFVMKRGAVIYKRAIADLDSISYENTLINRRSIVEKFSTDSHYSIFFQALVATGLVDSLKLDRDKTYSSFPYSSLITAPKSDNQWFYQLLPDLRRYGFTILAENDSVMKLNGIESLSTLKDYAASVYNQMYPEDAGITDLKHRKNSLNRFVAYHIINKKLSLAKFIDAYDTEHMLKTCDMYEYLEPMCPNTLIEIKKERTTGLTNLINASSTTKSAIHILSSSDGQDVFNGFYYGIDGMLVYSQAVDNELSSKRLRFDAASFFPELTNNDMRGRPMATPSDQVVNFQIPDKYISRVSMSGSTKMGYLSPFAKFQDYQGDEIFFASASGSLYEFSIVMPPVPAGTYEVRLGYLANGRRGVIQTYFDGVPAEEVVNLNNLADHPLIGYEKPKTVAWDYNGFYNDKALRNHGYMKAPASFKVPVQGWTFGENARFCENSLRKILGIYSFKTASNHTLTVKALSVGEFMLDYIEFVPTSCLNDEDIY